MNASPTLAYRIRFEIKRLARLKLAVGSPAIFQVTSKQIPTLRYLGVRVKVLNLGHDAQYGSRMFIMVRDFTGKQLGNVLG